MRRRWPNPPTPETAQSANLAAATNQCKTFTDALIQRIEYLHQRNPQWPGYVWEEVEPYSFNPNDPEAQPVLDLSTRIGNINLRFDALFIALDNASS